jgi:formylglycine-generating enzyme required for sulfatase activity
MKKKLFSLVIMLIFTGIFLQCGGGGGGGDDSSGAVAVTFDNASTPGDAVTVTAGGVTFRMIYANNQSSITFPTDVTDGTTATLSTKFFMAETEVTNALMAEVLQWAYDNGKIVESSGVHNEVSSDFVKYGNQVLLGLDKPSIKINYASGSFTVDSGFENYPVTDVSWFGAIMFCNWLTEMKEGNTVNLVYSGMDTIWLHDETVETPSNTGYRLPSSNEWEFVARYIGATAPGVVNLASECIYYNKGGAYLSLTPGYYWTPGDYASGAVKDTSNETETRTVAWYSGDPAMVPAASLQPVAQKTANQLGIFDMSGSVWELCFTPNSGTERIIRGGSLFNAINWIMLSGIVGYTPHSYQSDVGFRIAKTK